MMAAAVLAAATSVIFLPGRADAHAAFVGSEPANGAFVDHAPERIVVRFSETVAAPVSRAWSVAESGERRSLQVLTGGNDRELAVVLPPSISGVVQVEFQAVGSDDFHRVAGAVTFGVGVPAVLFRQPPAPAPPALVEILGRIVAYLGVALVAGVPLLVWSLTSVEGSLPFVSMSVIMRRRLSRLLRYGCVAVVVGQACEIVRAVTALRAPGEWPPLATVLGSAPVQSAVGASAVAIAAARSARRTDGKLVVVEQLVLAVAIAAFMSAAAHRLPFSPLMSRTLSTVHMASAAGWIGALFVAVAVAGRDRGLLGALLRRSANSVIVCASVAVSTGAVMAVRHVPRLDQATGTAYGQVLAAKLVAVVALCVVGAVRSFRLTVGGTLTGRAHGIVLPAAIAAAWGAAALTATAPASTAPVARVVPQPPRAASDERAGLQVTTVLVGGAGQPGSVVVKPRSLSLDGGGIGSVELRVSGSALADPVDVRPGPLNGTFQAPIRIARAGAVIVKTTIERAGRGRDVFSSTLYVAEPSRVPRLIFPPVRTAAAQWFALFMGLGAVSFVVVRRGR